ncbi:histidinol-phosphate transaminase [Gallaecimonas sp. GXIMD4217]|uniref:histidinol-phosphate transaminase n=1 Tax=Gallaecimonas sp. GXIMD4217 TaxID=3131927 RepID=UPI00311B0591
MSIEQLARKAVRELSPYQSARRIGGQGQVWLNANEAGDASPYGFEGSLNRYPECQPPALLAAYAAYAGVEPSLLLATRGADEGIELLIRAFCEPGDAIAIQSPTYGMYAIGAQTQGAEVLDVPLQGGELDLPGLAAVLDRVKLVFVCRPNNPTGQLCPAAQVQALLALAAGRALVVVDEAYIEFSAAETLAPLLARHDNLVLLRTFSKAFGLAGLRLGMVLASPAIIALLAKVLAPYPVPLPVAEIAQRALAPQGLARLAARVAQVSQDRTRLAVALANLGYRPAPSSANFLLVADANGALFKRLASRGIVARALAGQTRISIGSTAEIRQLLEALNG